MEHVERPLRVVPWRRIAARVLDAAAVSAAFFVVGVSGVAWSLSSLADRLDPKPWGRGFVPTLLFVVLHGIHEVVFVTRRGQTPGRDLLDLRVQSADGPELLDAWRAVLRWLPIGACLLVRPLWLAGIGLVVLGVARGERTVLDRLARSRVVDHDSEASEGPRPAVAITGLRREGRWRGLFDVRR